MHNFVIQHSIDGLQVAIRAELETPEGRRTFRRPLLLIYVPICLALAGFIYSQVDFFWATIYTLAAWAVLWATRPRPEKTILRGIRKYPEKVRWYTSSLQLGIHEEGLAYDSGEVGGLLKWNEASIELDGPTYLILRGSPPGLLCIPLVEVPVDALAAVREALGEKVD